MAIDKLLTSSPLEILGIVIMGVALVWTLKVLKDKGILIVNTPFDNLSNHLEGKVDQWKTNVPTYSGIFQGRKFKLTTGPMSYEAVRNGFLNCQLKLKSRKLSDWYIIISRKEIKYTAPKQVKTGDAGFNALFHIYSDKPPKAKQYLYSDTRRDIIKQLVQKGWQGLTIHKLCIQSKAIYAYCYLKEPKFDPSVIEEALKSFIALES